MKILQAIIVTVISFGIFTGFASLLAYFIKPYRKASILVPHKVMVKKGAIKRDCQCMADSADTIAIYGDVKTMFRANDQVMDCANYQFKYTWPKNYRLTIYDSGRAIRIHMHNVFSWSFEDSHRMKFNNNSMYIPGEIIIIKAEEEHTDEEIQQQEYRPEGIFN